MDQLKHSLSLFAGSYSFDENIECYKRSGISNLVTLGPNKLLNETKR